MLHRTLWLAALAGAMACAEASPTAPRSPTVSTAPLPAPQSSSAGSSWSGSSWSGSSWSGSSWSGSSSSAGSSTAPVKDHAEPIDVGAPTGSTPDPNATDTTDRFLARLRATLRRCYERALESDPTMKGTLGVELRIDAQGRVTDVRMKPDAGLDKGLVRCIEARIRAIVLEPPPGAARTLAFPINIDSAR
jgi:hypothetical protein